MSDLLRIRAIEANGAGVRWEFLDPEKQGWRVALEPEPKTTIHEGEVWNVKLVGTDTTTHRNARHDLAIVQLIAKVQDQQPWQQVTELSGFWIEPIDLQCLLGWLHMGEDIILVGPKGTGKTTLAWKLCEALGWEEPCKVDISTIMKSKDLFGMQGAADGRSYFAKSAFAEYIDRARVAHQAGFPAQFLVVLDEVNRIHSKQNEGMHGLFDDTRQVTVTTTEGSMTFWLPPNVHTIGTMNKGAEYVGIHSLDGAILSRFQLFKMRAMPREFEVEKLVADTGISKRQSGKIVDTARSLREAANNGMLPFGPDYRRCRSIGRLLASGARGVDLKVAIVKGLLAYYDGDVKFENGKLVVEPNTEVAKAAAHLNMKGVVELGVVAAEAAADATMS